jgi:hypothetical protein
VVHSLTLSGYAVYCIREWMDAESEENRECSFRKTIVVKTGRSEDVICVMAVRGVEESAAEVLASNDSALLLVLQLQENRFGQLLCVSDSDFAEIKRFGDLTGARLPSGVNFGEIEAEISEFCVARQLLWPRLQDFFSLRLSEAWRAELCREFKTTESCRTIVREAQILLKLVCIFFSFFFLFVCFFSSLRAIRAWHRWTGG